MTQEQAVIALRDAAENGGDHIIDTDRERIVGQVKGSVKLSGSGRITFTVYPVPRSPSIRRYERTIVGAKVLRVEKVKRAQP